MPLASPGDAAEGSNSTHPLRCIWIFALGLSLSCSAFVEARGLVGWPGSFKNSGFCKTYGCNSAKTVPSQGWGGPTTIYRLSKLPGATLHVHMPSENEIESAVLSFNGRVYTQLMASDSKATNAFLQAATGRKAAFSLSECRKSETPGRARPPVLIDDGAGHLYRMSCVSVRASDISKEQAAALGITPKTLTGIAVEPQY